jgi:hypothetical protein
MSDQSQQLDLLKRALLDTGDEAPLDVILVSWFLHHVMAVDDLDTYQYVTSDEARVVDGMFLEQPFDSSERAVLHVFEAKVPETPAEIGPEAVQRLLSAVAALRSGNLDTPSSPELRLLGLRERFEAIDPASIEVRGVLLAASQVSPEARKLADKHAVDVFDLKWLADFAKALSEPGLRRGQERLACDAAHRFATQTGTGKLVVAEVRANEIARWKGIDDRSLFGLNVRGDLGPNRLRVDLERAIRDPSDRSNFLAYHNGITVLCGKIDPNPVELLITDLSVVNGAQSVLAFRLNEENLTDDMTVLVKFVEAPEADPIFATEVARRSNSQTAVNARNLRANDGRQRTLIDQFRRDFPQYSYITKPDATKQPAGEQIKNDDAAQLLCAVYNERPWLAVKRIELFREPNYALIFNARVTAAHIVLVFRMRTKVEDARDKFPEAYRRSWRLTALIATYLTGQAMRSDPGTEEWLRDPSRVAKQDGEIDAQLNRAVLTAAETMTYWHQQRIEEFGFDDFKVDFKRENIARSLTKLMSKIPLPAN